MNEQNQSDFSAMEAEHLQVSFHLEKKDFKKFNQYFFLQKGLRKRIGIIIFAALLLPLLLNGIDDFSLLNYLVNVLLAGVVFSIIYVGGMLLLLKFASLPPDAALGYRKFTITDKALIEETSNTRNSIDWNGIHSVEQNSNYVFVFMDRMTAYVIPKRGFKNKHHELAFYNLLTESI